MKTSDKLLLGTAVLILGLLLTIQLILYNSYKHGDIMTAGSVHAERYTRYTMPAPQYLQLSGVLWANIIPSDTFYIEFPNDHTAYAETPGFEGRNTTSYRSSGDTVLISGPNEQAVWHPFADWLYRVRTPQVNVYCRDLREIRLHKGYLYLKGDSDGTALSSAHLVIDSSTVWIGELMDDPRPTAPKEFFKSLDVRLTNSILLINRPAIVHTLRARVEDHSEINDREAVLDSLDIHSSNNSRIALTGSNLKKAQLSLH
jgi:hypothetical protein